MYEPRRPGAGDRFEVMDNLVFSGVVRLDSILSSGFALCAVYDGAQPRCIIDRASRRV